MKGYADRVQGVLLVALALNAIVAVGKLAAGFAVDSLAVIADGLHSGVDALANVAALLVLRFASRPADEDHPFGHARYETLAAFALSGILVLTAFELGRTAVLRIASPHATSINALTFAVMLGTLAVNVFVAWYEGRQGKRFGSHLLRADAAQTRGDVVVSLGVIVGLVLQVNGFVQLDGYIALGVALFIGVSAWHVFQEVAPVLTDRIVYDPAEVARVVRGVPGVVNVHDIRSRGTAGEAYVQMHLVVDRNDVEGAHAIADEVERRVARELGAKETFVHVEPTDDASGPPGSRGELSPA